jgi:hypothetical protein
MSQNSKNQGFSYYLCLIKEGSGSVQVMVDTDPGSSNNIWIRVHNTGINVVRERGDPEECACSTRLRRWSTQPRRWSGTFSSPSRQAPRAGQALDPKSDLSLVMSWEKWESHTGYPMPKGLWLKISHHNTSKQKNIDISDGSVADPWHFGTDPDPRIRGSVDLTNGSGSGPGYCYFRSSVTFRVAI